jgi:hypothetical protein
LDTPFSPALQRISGRIERLLTEAIAFGWQGWGAIGIHTSATAIAKVINPGWKVSAFLASEDKLARQQSLLGITATSAPIIAAFNRLDVAASVGAGMHRDQVWLVHIAGALAVYAAVSGSLSETGAGGSGHGWAVVELVALAVIGVLTFLVQRLRLQERWTACRLAAERLRIALICQPLLVVPTFLQGEDVDPPTGRPDFDAIATQEVRRVVREAVSAVVQTQPSRKDGVEWLKFFVDDQLVYHNNNLEKLECFERRLNNLITVSFFVTLLTVLVHFFVEAPRLLLVTAAGPAILAALHGTATRLGIVHRIALSRDTAAVLKGVKKDLDALSQSQANETDDWHSLQRLAIKASEAMAQENLSWHGLLRREKDHVPA